MLFKKLVFFLNEQTNGKRPKFWDEVMNVFTWINRDVWLWMSEIHIQSWWQWSITWNMFWSIELFNFFFPSKNFHVPPSAALSNGKRLGARPIALAIDQPARPSSTKRWAIIFFLHPHRGSSVKNLIHFDLKVCFVRQRRANFNFSSDRWLCTHSPL